ncbi:MAG TPA: hypothetical protein VHQ24_09140, partial [Lachnospiraceae bacterium]|nr:hypothetical protein [Lachnospiraceae bacterium]
NNGIMSDIQYGRYNVMFMNYGTLVPNNILIDDATEEITFAVTGKGTLDIYARYNAGTETTPDWVNAGNVRFKRVANDYTIGGPTFGNATSPTDQSGHTTMESLPVALPVYVALDPDTETDYILDSAFVGASILGGEGSITIDLSLKTKSVNFKIEDTVYPGVPVSGSLMTVRWKDD